MSALNWQEVLGWNDEQLNDLRAIAFSYIQQGVYDVALTFFDALAVLTPQTPYDLQTLGALYLQMGLETKALDYLDRALMLKPDHLPTQLNRAKTLLLLGYKGQGLKQAMEVEKSGDALLSSRASALILAYQ